MTSLWKRCKPSRIRIGSANRFVEKESNQTSSRAVLKHQPVEGKIVPKGPFGTSSDLHDPMSNISPPSNGILKEATKSGEKRRIKTAFAGHARCEDTKGDRDSFSAPSRGMDMTCDVS
jgi:hypothetical protein